jgi:hypothetical protein
MLQFANSRNTPSARTTDRFARALIDKHNRPASRNTLPNRKDAPPDLPRKNAKDAEGKANANSPVASFVFYRGKPFTPPAAALPPESLG